MRLHIRCSIFSAALLSALAGVSPACAQNAFITNTSDNTVSIIDVPSGTVIGAVPVDSEPQGVAVAADGTTVYVTNLFGINQNNQISGTVSVINAAQFPQAVTATVASPGTFPPGITLSPDGTKAYFTNGLTATPELSVIDTATNMVTGSIAVPGTPGAGVAVSPDGGHVYVPNGTTTGIVTVISIAANGVSASIPVGPNPEGIAITPNGAKAYVTQENAPGVVTVINLANNTVSTSIAVGNNPIGVAISPDGTKAYVANHGDNSVSIINVATDTIQTTISVGQGPFGVSFTPDGTAAYVANKTDNTVSVIDVASTTVASTIAVGQAPGALGTNFIGKAQPPSVLLSSVLPGGRSVQVGANPTAFATVLNTGSSALNNCRILLPTSAPAGMTMSYATTNPATNAVTSADDPMVTIPANGSQSFVIAFEDTSPALDPSQPLLFVCDGTTYAPIVVGLNTIDLQFSSTPIADVIALAATASNNGIVEVPLSMQGAGAFAVASDNIGESDTITVTADTGAATLPLDITLCQTSSNGQCLAPPAPSVTLNYTTNLTPTFSVFITASANVPFAPATSRIFVRFLDGAGVSHGSTSVAVETN